MSSVEAWVIHAESPGQSPRSTDDPFFPWQWGEVIAVLPPDASALERAAALAAVAQAAHFFGESRAEIPDFANRSGYLYRQATDEYFDGAHPYLSVSAARNVRYVPPEAGETRGRVEFEGVPLSER